MFSGQDASKEKKGAKQTVSAKAGTERRQRQLMSVRHKAHDDLMKHLRTEGNDEAEDGAAGASNKTVWDFDVKSAPSSVPMSLFPEFVNLMLNGTTEREVFQGTMLIRKVLAVNSNPPYDVVCQPPILQRLIELTTHNQYPELQFEAAWALTNIAAGTTQHTLAVIKSGAVGPLIELARSPDPKCRDQACWALGNMAGENAECRDLLLSQGALPRLIEVMQRPQEPVFVMRNASWAASNLTRGRPAPDLSLTIDAVPIFAALLTYHDDQVIGDALWALSFISDGNRDRVQCIIDAGIVERVVELLISSSTMLRVPATRIVGNIASGSDEQTQTIINAGVLQHMGALLKSRRSIRKEACWMLSNIAAGKTFQIDALVNSGVFVPLLECLRQPELDVKKEAVWTVANVSFCGTPDHIKYLMSVGYIDGLCEVLSVTDSKILTVCLEALQLFLRLADDEHKAGKCDSNYVAEQMLHNGATQIIESLQSHTERDVYNLALSIISEFFLDESEHFGFGGGEDANVMQDLFSAPQPGAEGGGHDGGIIQL